MEVQQNKERATGHEGRTPTVDDVGGFCELEGLFGDLVDQLPTSLAHDDQGPSPFELSATTLAQPPSHLSTNEIRLRRGLRHVWGPHGVYETRDLIGVEATKRTYRLWGLLILATVFHQEPDPVTLELSHPDSELRQFLIGGTPGPGSQAGRLHSGSPSQYSTAPDSFLYVPPTTQPWPWPDGIEVKHLPCFWLAAPQSGSSPDRVVGFGSDRASILLAELLLNVGLLDSTRDEYNLEGESLDTGVWSVRSLGPSTADVTLWLPGAIGYLSANPGGPLG